MDTGREQVTRELVSLVGEAIDLVSSLNDELTRTTLPHHMREERSRKIQEMKERHEYIARYIE